MVDGVRFTELVCESFPHEQILDVDGLVDRVVSVSFIAMRSPVERARIADRVRSLAAGRDRIALAYRTEVWWCLRRERRPGDPGVAGWADQGRSATSA